MKGNRQEKWDPEKTPLHTIEAAELQRAVDAAAGCRALADCMMYGLITGPKIDVERCDLILEAGRARGIHPSMPDVDLAVGMGLAIKGNYILDSLGG